VIAGVSGSGKSTVGRGVAARLGLPFIDSDDLHPPENVAKMRSGVPLEDADRVGWLERVAREAAAREEGVVVACSSLKRSHRELLRRGCPGLVFVLLRLEPAEIRRRMELRQQREGHFMPASLLDSQLATLEPGEDFLIVDNEGEPEEVVGRVVGRVEG